MNGVLAVYCIPKMKWTPKQPLSSLPSTPIPKRSLKNANDLVLKESVCFVGRNVKHKSESIHSDEGLKPEISVFESFTVANLPYRPCGV